MYEEIGLDVRGMVKKDWVIQRDLLGHSNKMFIVPDIPEDTVFATRTRKEIAVCVCVCVRACMCMCMCVHTSVLCCSATPGQ